ncbi:G-type lectin S-receptor-like serine/threonine-protein kinase At4g27290 [Rhodamnia argentea]|uniref:Receptor-like serine/threonine-protein kinase n=1 Tax=Rhodamnia argentea TaxID=178133 RepID=A0A8B8QUW3_9MYRT|nr:G-type lectin S-receptor-like serine/threonine-protein kinase At4g27290 [Rhodamnia argentea]
MAKITFSVFIIVSMTGLSLAADTLGTNHSIGYGETLVSSDLTFELGFFTPGNSSMSFLGIWFKFSPETVVWVANRNNPFVDRDGVLTFSNVGNLVVLNQSNGIVWSSKSSRFLRNPAAQLLDSGNLVLWDNSSSGSDEAYVWQSFDYPSDTLLAGMKLGSNLKTGLEQRLTAWKSMDDPSPGDYVYGLNYSQGLPQYELVQMDVHRKLFRTGEWDGVQFFEVSFSKNPVTVLMFVYNETEISFMFQAQNSQLLSRLTLSYVGALQVFVVNRSRSGVWSVMHKLPTDPCDSYGMCGANAVCDLSLCECVKGFMPRSPDEWLVRDFSSGCKRTIPLDCSKGEGFLEVEKVKLPDLLEVTVNKSMSLKECKEECLKNCSCTAYANSDIRGGGSGCLMWYGDLIDMRASEEQNYGQTLYVRVSASELDAIRDRTRRKIILVAVILSSIIGGFLLVGTALWFVKRRKSRIGIGVLFDAKTSDITLLDLEITKEDIDLPLYDLPAIVSATNNFSDDNRIGAGGFGPVYKGNLQTGQLVAVKRLSRSSGQGLEEFKNEVLLIARLQHRNLVGLLGCCIEGEERILLYEYMDNKSLNYFIFDQEKSLLLTWQRRFDIIVGIARGLLYLHHDSKLQVIHRDLKTSNILLDGDLNPKISDFGLARIFGANQKEARTKRVIGTYGYMAPEYAIDGKFSVKSDIYSFGVLLLEIISGKRNRGFSHPSHHHNLLGHAWLLWGEGRALELMDECLHNSFDRNQVERCIQVGLLCVQKFPEDRPAMCSAIGMILNFGYVLPEPKEPAYFTERNSGYSDGASSKESSHTQNAVTLTMPEGR